MSDIEIGHRFLVQEKIAKSLIRLGKLLDELSSLLLCEFGDFRRDLVGFNNLDPDLSLRQECAGKLTKLTP